MKLTDHAKTLSLSLADNDDSRLGAAFLIAYEAMKEAVGRADVSTDPDAAFNEMYEIITEAMAAIRAI